MDETKLGPGGYKVTDQNDPQLELIILVGGRAPFLTLDTIWDNNNNRTVSDISLRGKDPRTLNWERL